MFGIDGIAHFRARKDDGNDAVAALDADRRRRLPLGNRRDLARVQNETVDAAHTQPQWRGVPELGDPPRQSDPCAR